MELMRQASADARVWVAVGFSRDSKMVRDCVVRKNHNFLPFLQGDDSVAACVSNGSGGGDVLLTYNMGHEGTMPLSDGVVHVLDDCLQ